MNAEDIGVTVAIAFFLICVILWGIEHTRRKP